MKLLERIVEFQLLGQVFSFRTDLPEEMVREIQQLLTQKEREIQKKYKLLPPLKVAVLMLLQISSEYVKIKNEYQDFRKALVEKASKIDDYIKKNSLGCA